MTLKEWLVCQKIEFEFTDDEVVNIPGFGKMYIEEFSLVDSIFKGEEGHLQLNLQEIPEVLMEENIFHVAFPFGNNWYYHDLREKFKFNILKYIGKRNLKKHTPFVNLGVHSPFELLNGSGDIADWVKKAKYLGHEAIGICDKNTMAATLNLQKECEKAGIKHVFGYTLSLIHEDECVEMKIYCQNQNGLQNLLRIQKAIMVDSPNNTIGITELIRYAEGNILVFGKLSSFWMSKYPGIVEEIKAKFGNTYYQIDLSEYKAERIDVEVLKSTRHFFENFYRDKDFVIEPILISDSYYLDKDDARNKIILNKIAQGAAHEQSDDQYFKDIDDHFQTFASLFDSNRWNIESLFERLCRNTVIVAKQAEAHFETGRMYMPEYIMLPEEKDKYINKHEMFLQLIETGLQEKIPVQDHVKYRERLKEEIYTIESTNNCSYFLILYDMIKEARKRHIAVGVGRGSAGGSLVAYLLNITSIDPIQYQLLFSRFLVPERCGLSWVERTVICKDIQVSPGDPIIVIQIDGCQYAFHPDAELLVERSGNSIQVYADEVSQGDNILFDQRDILWTLNEINDRTI